METSTGGMVEPGTDILIGMFMTRSGGKGMFQQQRMERQHQQYITDDKSPPATYTYQSSHRHCGHQPKNSRA